MKQCGQQCNVVHAHTHEEVRQVVWIESETQSDDAIKCHSDITQYKVR